MFSFELSQHSFESPVNDETPLDWPTEMMSLFSSMSLIGYC